MKRTFQLILGIVVLIQPAMIFAQRAVFVVRHAERLDESEDAPLSKAGEVRAERLAAMLKDAGITAIFTTKYRRTINTAAPIAKQLSINSVVSATDDPAAFVQELKARYARDIVLVVGHSNTVPNLLKALGHTETITIGSNDYDSLFVLVPRNEGAPVFLRLKF